ncbi:MAG: hypothetical protein TREMPRED_002036 [Tremellales sp. Tagirdzhanova-0007]|nr:MAG: hypothetical protein TREMPRED_002036 [Tremellales sp. Tagirdzhanova-0007]
MSFWEMTENLWSALVFSFDPIKTSITPVSASEESRIRLAISLGKLERNLIAGLESHQQMAVHHEPDIRSLIFNITTFARIGDERFFTLQAVLTQLVSNIISPVSTEPSATRIADDLLSIYLRGGREDDVILRLLDSQDLTTNTATLHLINNVTRNSLTRMLGLLSPAGLGWLSKILGHMEKWLDCHDGRFELACELVNSVIDQNLHATLFHALSTPDEPISPSQTVLLKVLETHLSSSIRDDPTPSPNVFLVPLFLSLAQYSISSMRSGKDDARLPKIFEGLVLVSEGFSGIGLAVQGRRDRGQKEDRGGEEMSKAMKKETIKPIIDLLRELNAFLPRVKPSVNTSLPSTSEAAPLSSVKRNLVRLLGILTFEDTAVGDLVREYDGVHLILSMTEVDELNPYLREHALFVTRNLMLRNPANQALIAEMDPVGVVSETGELLPLPERMRREAKERHDNANG